MTASRAYAETQVEPVPLVTREAQEPLALREQPGTQGRQVLPDAQAPSPLQATPGLLGRRVKTVLRQLPALRVPQAVPALPARQDLQERTERLPTPAPQDPQGLQVYWSAR